MKLSAGWMKMEAAPKTGEWIIAVNARQRNGRQHVVHYSERHTTNPRLCWVTDAQPMSFVADLTHWMPLTAPPNLQEDE